jgi:DNA-binding CsgD family transcriptional regulator
MTKLVALHNLEQLATIGDRRSSLNQTVSTPGLTSDEQCQNGEELRLPERAIIQFTADRKFVHANPSGHSELRDGHILGLTNGLVLAADPENDRMIAQAIIAVQTVKLLVFSTVDKEFVALRLDFEADIIQCTMRRSGYQSDRLNLEIGAISGLTKAERRILGFILENFTMEEIAGKIGNSIETVRTHRKRIYSKMGVQGRADLLVMITRALT